MLLQEHWSCWHCRPGLPCTMQVWVWAQNKTLRGHRMSDQLQHKHCPAVLSCLVTCKLGGRSQLLLLIPSGKGLGSSWHVLLVFLLCKSNTRVVVLCQSQGSFFGQHLLAKGLTCARPHTLLAAVVQG
jgi:hypothetical protein